MLRKKVIFNILIFIALAIGLSQTPARQANKVNRTYNDSLVAGGRLFRQTCGACHKLDMKLFGPPLYIYPDKPGGLARYYNPKTRNHRQAPVTKAQFELIELYLKDAVGPKPM